VERNERAITKGTPKWFIGIFDFNKILDKKENAAF
jgi:hypothetical protein